MLNRWLPTGGLLCLFMLRIILAQGVRIWPKEMMNSDPSLGAFLNGSSGE